MKYWELFIQRLLLFIIIIALVSCRNEDFAVRNDNSTIAKSFEENFFLIKKGDNMLVVKSFDQQNEYFLLDDMLFSQTEVSIVKKFESPKEAEEYIDNKNNNLSTYNNSNVAKSSNSFGAIQQSTRLWENGVIYLAIGAGSDFSTQQKSDIYKAASLWAQKTKLKFKIVSVDDSYSKIVINSVKEGCSCTTGSPAPSKNGSMNLSITCDVQSILHELGHAIGFIHEHQRPLRNQKLKGLYTNSDYEFIRNNVGQIGLDGNAVVASIKNNLEVINVIDDSAPFDYRSVMMYGSYPRNNLKLLEFLKNKNMPFYKDLNNQEIPRPTFGITDLDKEKVLKAYPNLPN